MCIGFVIQTIYILPERVCTFYDPTKMSVLLALNNAYSHVHLCSRGPLKLLINSRVLNKGGLWLKIKINIYSSVLNSTYEILSFWNI